MNEGIGMSHNDTRFFYAARLLRSYRSSRKLRFADVGAATRSSRHERTHGRRRLECRLDAQADVFAADVVVEFGLPHQPRRLFRRSAEDQGAPGSVQSVQG